MPRRNPDRAARPEDLRDEAEEAWAAEEQEDDDVQEIPAGHQFVPVPRPPPADLEWPDLTAEDNACPSCLEPVGAEGEPTVCRVCKKAFCFGCIQRWLDEGGEQGDGRELGGRFLGCPNCRAEVRDEEGWLDGRAFGSVGEVLGEYREMEGEQRRLVATNQVLAHELAALRRSYGALGEENARLREQEQHYGFLQAANVRLERENERLRAQVDALTRRLEDLQLADRVEAVAAQLGDFAGDDAADAEAADALARLDDLQLAERLEAAAAALPVRDPVRVYGGEVVVDRAAVAAAAEARSGLPAVRGGPINDGQQPGPSRQLQVQPAWMVGRRAVPSRFRGNDGIFRCPACDYNSRQRSHAGRHFRTRHGGTFFAEFSSEGGQRQAPGGFPRREHRRRQVRGLMAFMLEEEEDVEYEYDEDPQ